MIENTNVKNILKELKYTLTEKEFDMLGRLSKESIENISNKIEEKVKLITKQS
jgi:hypothetical protein